MKAKIIIVEDDPNIVLGLEELLKLEGFDVAVCRRGNEAVSKIKAERPSLVVLDIMLPGLNGFEICKQLRAEKITTPVLMLTAKSQEMDKVIGLDLGADDYLTKPFGVRELIARINALLRRQQGAEQSIGTFQIGACTIDARRYELRREDKAVELTARELKILELFHKHPGEVFSRDKLLNEVWGYKYFGTTRTLDQVIVQLRKKLGDSAEKPRHLITVHGVGYKLIL